jgi:two-component system nitrogen regulation response regulator GlnG
MRRQGEIMAVGKSTAQKLPENRQLFDLMGHSFSVHQINRKIQQVAHTNFTVIIQGETGTGKELVARLLHDYSDRADKPFLAVDCGAIPDTLVESELFGYVKGAFTGAEGKKAGYFELAKGGTLFLDEIANLPPSIQIKLLRSVQDRQILPLGSGRNVATNVRIIVASNVVLEDEIQAGRFRADLFHRLNEFKIYLLPIRDRREDILFLAERFRRETNIELRKNIKEFSPEAKTYMLAYDWPGNVRELRNAVRRAVLLSTHTIELKHLRQAMSPSLSTPTIGSPIPMLAVQQGYSLHDIVNEVTTQLEKSLIQHALHKTNGNKTQAAKLLKIGHKTLYRKMRGYAID